MHNAMAQALIDAGYAKQDDKRGKFKAEWNAKLSYRSYQAFKAQGIPANPNEVVVADSAQLKAA